MKALNIAYRPIAKNDNQVKKVVVNDYKFKYAPKYDRIQTQIRE